MSTSPRPVRIRTVLFAGVVTGATAFAGVGLAAAAGDGASSADDQPSVTLPDAAADNAPSDLGSGSHGASDRSRTAAAEDQDGTAGPAVAPAEEGDLDSEGAEPFGHTGDSHGAMVSSVAQETEPGPEHGEAVSAAARLNHGQEQASEVRQDDGGETGDVQTESAETETDEEAGSDETDDRGASADHRP